jgi:probable addiction module antidote protein
LKKRRKKMEKIKTSKWDPAEDIETKEDVIAYLEVALEENDPEFLQRTIGYIVRSKGMAQLVRELDIDRTGAHKSHSPKRNQSFTTVMKVLNNLGFQVNVMREKAS